MAPLLSLPLEKRAAQRGATRVQLRRREGYCAPLLPAVLVEPAPPELPAVPAGSAPPGAFGLRARTLLFYAAPVGEGGGFGAPFGGGEARVFSFSSRRAGRAAEKRAGGGEKK